MTPLTRADLQDMITTLVRSRDEALDRQDIRIEKLFDAKIDGLSHALANLSVSVAKHIEDDRNEFREIRQQLGPIQESIALTKLKVAGLVAATGLVAGGISTFLVKHFMSIVVTK